MLDDKMSFSIFRRFELYKVYFLIIGKLKQKLVVKRKLEKFIKIGIVKKL